MAEFINSSILYRHVMATEEVTYDLVTNPVSHLILTIEGYNVTDEAIAAEIMAFINQISVTHKGVGYHNYQSEELAMLNLRQFGNGGMMVSPIALDNQYRSYSFIIPFGRKLYDPSECFPKTTKGEFQLTLNTTVPTASLDNAVISIGAVELPGASPTRFIKATTKSVSAPGATGAFDIDLPRGNPYFGLLIRQTTYPGASSLLYTVGEHRLMFDNKELNYASTKTSTLIAEMMNRVQSLNRSGAAQGQMVPANCTWMDFDPMNDNNYLIDSATSNELKYRGIFDISEPIWLTPLELIPASVIGS